MITLYEEKDVSAMVQRHQIQIETMDTHFRLLMDKYVALTKLYEELQEKYEELLKSENKIDASK
jgi:hypothetical protein